ncbi:MAG: glycosyltransferase, partial [Lewinella sp.]|nr:glycosyltransferase [Lewinella sp.]
MKFVLTSVGTRGDMEPFVAIGALLRAQGHEVICAFPEQFRSLAEGAKLAFASTGTQFIELLDSEAGRAAMGGASGWKKVVGTLQLAVRQKAANQELLAKQRDIIEGEQPDRVLYNGKAVYPMIWGLRHEGQAIMISPVPYMHYVPGHAHVAFNGDHGPFLNRLTFALARFGLITTIRISLRWLGVKTGFSRQHISDFIQYGRAIYTISPTLFPRPDEWPDSLQVLGYHEKPGQPEWQPDATLTDFLAQHEKPLF